MAKKWTEMVVKWPFMSQFYFESDYRNLPCFSDSMYNFQSPNYPQSLGNESYMCTLKIHHTPTLEELIAAANVRS